MKKHKFPILLTLGAVLILIGLALVVVFQIRVHTGSAERQEVLAKMEVLLPDRSAGVPGAYPNANMPVLEIDGVDYAAMLEIPSLNVTLPVADKWNSDKLLKSPARFYGSAYGHSLVIGGADTAQQFSFCDKIQNGTLVTVTDMTGAQFSYTVVGVDRSASAESQWLIRQEYDLTLFCRDTYATEYIAVRCKFAYR